MTRLLLVSDIHHLNNPNDLTADQLRKQWYPSFMMKSWVPLPFVQRVVASLRNSSLRSIQRLKEKAARFDCDLFVTLGDQFQGIAERGIEGTAGRKLTQEFLRLFQGMARGDAIHVPSEHCLGYWEGEDYFPYLKWERGFLRLKFIYPREIGGQLSEEAISNWIELIGPLWGMQEIGNFKMVWMDCDLPRWEERITTSSSLALKLLLRDQREFLYGLMHNADLRSVILLTYRPDAVFQEPAIRNYTGKLKAVVFSHHHFDIVARNSLRNLSPHDFPFWFVPSLSREFVIGIPRFAMLEINGSATNFQVFSL